MPGPFLRIDQDRIILGRIHAVKILDPAERRMIGRGGGGDISRQIVYVRLKETNVIDGQQLIGPALFFVGIEDEFAIQGAADRDCRDAGQGELRGVGCIEGWRLPVGAARAEPLLNAREPTAANLEELRRVQRLRPGHVAEDGGVNPAVVGDRGDGDPGRQIEHGRHRAVFQAIEPRLPTILRPSSAPAIVPTREPVGE